MKYTYCLAIAILLASAVRRVGAQSAVMPRPQQADSSPVVITLEEAIRRAKRNEPAFADAVASRGSAALDRSVARSALLPQVVYHNQYLYTQPNGAKNAAGQTGAQPAPRFIANNSTYEYVSQGQLNETIGVQQFAAYRRTGALSAQASAQLEIARRGLVASVVDAYYTLLAADQKLAVSAHAADEAHRFQTLSQQLEQGREVAHADVVKATLQTQQRERDLADAQLAAQRARLDLGVLLFADPRTQYRLADDTDHPPAPPLRGEVEAAAAKNNPDLNSALAALRVAGEEVSVARAAYLPDLSFNYSYGIDAPELATKGPDGVHNLGYSLSATLDIPIWDWLATHDRVKQSELRRQAAKTALNYTQRRLVAQLEELYLETSIANAAQLSLGNSVATAQESLRLINLRYSAGEATALEVVDAQNALVGADTARADGIVRYRLALANLQTLTGIMP